jgi:hypothetical protein
MDWSDIVAYAVAAIISGAAVYAAAKFGAKASDRSAASNFTANMHQIRTAERMKLAEFRQAWINQLRDAMAEFHAIGMNPHNDQESFTEFYKHGTKIELLMNRDDEDYPELQRLLYALLQAKTVGEKYAVNAPYVDVCQRIIKREWEVLKQKLREAESSYA